MEKQPVYLCQSKELCLYQLKYFANILQFFYSILDSMILFYKQHLFIFQIGQISN